MDYITTDTELTSVANAIRTKGGTSEQLVYPNGFVNAIADISTGAELTSEDEGKVVIEDDGDYILAEQTSQTITQNGTYDTTTVSELIAAISGGGGGSTNILSGSSLPTAQEGIDGSIYLMFSGSDSLPSGYTPVEYISSNGSQHIDTGVPARVQQKVVIDCQWQGSRDQTVLGGSSNTNTNTVYLGYNSTNNRNYVGYNNSWHDFATNAVDNIRHLWEIDLKSTEQSVKVDKLTTATTTNNFSETTSTTTLYAFSRSDGSKGFVGSIYKIDIYDYLSNEALVRSLVPCIRDSDDAVGMYDLVNDIFYENIGSGSFLAGELADGSIRAVYLKVNGSWVPIDGQDIDDVNTGGGGSGSLMVTDETPSSSVGSDGTVCIVYWSIPNGYTPVEYIEVGSQSGPYIETDYTFSKDSAYELGFQYTGTPEANSMLFGASSGGKETTVVYTNGVIYVQAGSGNTTFSLDTDRHDVAALSDKFVIDGVEVGSPNWSNVPSQKAFVFFASNASGKKANNVRVFYAKLYRYGTVSSWLIPCVRDSDDAIGMYDIIGDTFYANSGTGTFTAGPEAAIGQIINDVLLKVDGTWVSIIGQDARDVNTGGGSSNIFTIAEVYSQDTSVVTMDNVALHGTQDSTDTELFRYIVPSSGTLVVAGKYISVNVSVVEYLKPLAVKLDVNFARTYDTSSGVLVCQWSGRSFTINPSVSGKFVVAIAKGNSNYMCPILYTLTDYGGVGNVLSGSFIAKGTVTLEDSEGNLVTVYQYGGMSGGYDGNISVKMKIDDTYILDDMSNNIEFFGPYNADTAKYLALPQYMRNTFIAMLQETL